jgi:hypothetical protein
VTNDRLLRIYLSNLPLGNYHTYDDFPGDLFKDGERVASVVSDNQQFNAGLLSALVHILNAREQSEIKNACDPTPAVIDIRTPTIHNVTSEEWGVIEAIRTAGSFQSVKLPSSIPMVRVNELLRIAEIPDLHRPLA